jgi:hypothetical protein
LTGRLVRVEPLAWYAITEDDWPEVKWHLLGRLER